MGVKSSITYVIFHYHAKLKIDSYDPSPLEKKVDFSCYTLRQFFMKTKITTTIIFS